MVKKTGDLCDEELHEAKRNPNVYLVPDFESEPDIPEAIEKYMAQNFKDIFISELEAWYTDPESFPELNYDSFQKWFSVTAYTMIFDTVRKALKRE